MLLRKEKKTKEKKKKKGGAVAVSPTFGFFYILGLYSLLFVCFNKHTRTRVFKKNEKKKRNPFKLCLQIHVWAKILSSNCTTKKTKQNINLWKGSLMEEKIKTDPRFARVGRVLRCHRACHVTPSKNATATDASSSSSHSSSNQSKAKRKSTTNQPTDSKTQNTLHHLTSLTAIHGVVVVVVVVVKHTI